MNIYPDTTIVELPLDDDTGRQCLELSFSGTPGPVSPPFLNPLTGMVCQAFIVRQQDAYHGPDCIPCESWPGETEPTDNDILPERFYDANDYSYELLYNWAYTPLPNSRYTIPQGWSPLVTFDNATLGGYIQTFQNWLCVKYTSILGRDFVPYYNTVRGPTNARDLTILGWEGSNTQYPNAYGTGAVRQRNTGVSYADILPGYYGKVCDWIYAAPRFVIAQRTRMLSGIVPVIAPLLLMGGWMLLSMGSVPKMPRKT